MAAITAHRSLRPARPRGAAVVSALALLAAADALFNYFWTENGIHGSGGAVLVVASMALVALAAFAISGRWGPGWLRAGLEVLIGLDFVGTLVAGYFLEAWIFVALVAVTALVWLVRLFARFSAGGAP